METKSLPPHTQPEAAAVADIIRRSIEPRKLELEDGRHVLLVPDGVDLKSVKDLMDEYRTEPERRRGTTLVTDLQSFIDLVKRFKDDDSVVFADRDPRKPALLAIIDYDRKGPKGSPRFGQHRIRYEFPLSEEWEAWTQMSGVRQSQRDFAEFLETRLADILDGRVSTDPSSNRPSTAQKFAELYGCTFGAPAKLLELSKSLTIHVEHKVTSAQNLSTGEGQIQFTETHSDERSQPVKIPGAILIGIRVFRNGQPYQMAARLRYRVVSGAITWSYDLHRRDVVFDDAVGGACELVKKETGLELFAGRPDWH